MNEKSLRKRALAGEPLLGTFLSTGSAVAAEIAGRSGLDWCLIDMEHGMGSWEMLLYQLMAVEGAGSSPIVRLPGLDIVYFKKALDMGAHGVMIPNVNTVEEAERAVSFSRFPPLGSRGVASMNRGAHFGRIFDEKLKSAHQDTVVIVQIESPEGVENVDRIAAIEGIDVLFVGPLDLSVNLGKPKNFETEEFRTACRKVKDAARQHAKASGILLLSVEEVRPTIADGFTFVGVGTDGGFLARAMSQVAKSKV